MLIGVVTHLFPLDREVHCGRAIYETIRALQGFADVEVLYPQAAYPGRPLEPRKYIWGGVPVTDIPYRAVPLLTRQVNGRHCARALDPHLRVLQCDLLLAYWLYPVAYAAIKLAAELGLPVVVGSRGSDLRRIPDPLTRRMVARTVQRAAHVLTVSEELRQRAIALGADPARTRTIPNGCERGVFHYGDPVSARRALGIAEEGPLMLYVGRLVADKGVADLLEAFGALSRENPKLRAAFIGNGPLAGRIAGFAKQHGLEDRILAPGAKPPDVVAQWMRAADVCCLPSYTEGCPNVVIEAISCGCPMVAADVGGVPEILPSSCGILTAAGQPARLADDLRAALSRSWNRETIAAAFGRTWEDAARETYEVCREAVAASRMKTVHA